MTPLRALIVDDEPLARERLRAMLRAEPAVQLAGECASGPKAIEWITRDRPDLVFLDVEMPGCDGLQVVAALDGVTRPAIIFVTAHASFAVQAFGVDAVDYLLKPFDLDRMRESVRRAVEYLRTRRAGGALHLEDIFPAPPAGRARPGRITVRTDGRVVFLSPEEIVWIEAADNYAILHLPTGERVMMRETLLALESRLEAAGFVRINRSALVNLHRVREFQRTVHGDYVVVLHDGPRLPLSRHLRGRIEQFVSDVL